MQVAAALSNSFAFGGLNAVLAVFGYSAENPTGVRGVWGVCAVSCFVGLLLFAPYKLGDTKEETKKIMKM